MKQMIDLTTKINSLNSRLGSVENFNSNISNLDALKYIDFNNISYLVWGKASIEYVDNGLSLKQNTINSNNKLSGSNVQTTYPINNVNVILNDEAF